MRLRAPNEIATPVRTSRQWTTALSPDAAGTGWSYISASWVYQSTNEIEWAVVKELTTSPTQATFSTPTKFYPNTNFQYTNQIRAANGRIFFPLWLNRTAYYDPSTESVQSIGPIVETPPINPNASTIGFSASFDVAGLLYTATQESENRPSCVVVTNTSTLTQTILGYVGDGQQAYTTYGYYIAPDTVTADKFIYVAYGQDPWQLWALNIATGTATKLYEVPSSGHIAFQDIVGQGWVATIDTAVGQPGNVTTKWWCLDGAIYAYTVGVAPPLAARNVTPASNPLVSPPQIDVSRGAGQVLWRPNGSSGDYTLVEYDVEHVEDIAIESVIALSDGTALGNAEQYQGFFRYYSDSNTTDWYGNWAAVSQPALAEVGGLVYITGYPNSALYRYDPSAPWVAGINPVSLSTFGATAHTHYPYCLEYNDGRLYMLGRRERTGVGAGASFYNIATAAYTGTTSDLTFGNPVGLIVLPDIRRVVASIQPLDGSPGVIVVFDFNLVEVARWTVSASWTDPGKLYSCNDGQCVIGVSATHGVAYRYNVVSGTLQRQVALGGSTSPKTQPDRGGEILVLVGTDLKSIDPNTLQVTNSFSGYAGVGKVASGKVLYFTNGPTLYQQSKVSENKSRSSQRRRRRWSF